MLAVNQQQIQLDPEGYLQHVNDWSPEVALALAEQEGLSLSAQHWEVIHLVRQFYQNYQLAPAIRILVKAMAKQLGADKGSSIYLHQLFPGAAKQISKIAGLPKPTRCI